jgi:F-type H+-transporting ATPase subunit b
MADRQKLIADGLAAGERGKHELELAGKRSADALRDAKAKAAEVIAAAEKRGAQMVEEAKLTAKVEADKVVASRRPRLPNRSSRPAPNCVTGSLIWPWPVPSAS